MCLAKCSGSWNKPANYFNASVSPTQEDECNNHCEFANPDDPDKIKIITKTSSSDSCEATDHSTKHTKLCRTGARHMTSMDTLCGFGGQGDMSISCSSACCSKKKR